MLVASDGGADRHPDWYLNLLAHPEAELRRGTRTLRVRTRTAAGAERDELWRTAVAGYRGYAGYQRRTRRTIPVVVCAPLPTGAAGAPR